MSYEAESNARDAVLSAISELMIKGTLEAWARRAPAGSRAAKLIELWYRRGASPTNEATRDQALTLAPLLTHAAVDKNTYEINSQGTGLVSRPKV